MASPGLHLHSTTVMVAVSLLFFVFSPLKAQAPQEKHVLKITGTHPDWSGAGPQELFAPYWTLEPGWNTELEMRNNLPWRELRMTPVLRTTDGAEVSLVPVNLKPEEISSINLRDAVSNVRPELVGKIGSVGSVVFRFEGTAAGNGFAAAVVRREGRPIDFHFDAEGGGAKEYEGLWWVPSETATAYLILSNPTNTKVDARVTFSGVSGGILKRVTLHLGSGQSIRTDIRETLGNSAVGAFGGLSLSVEKEGTLSANEIVYDEASGLATTLRLFERQMLAEADTNESRNLRAPMMAFTQPDRSLGFPGGTKLEPRIFLRNASASSTTISPSVNWRSDSLSGRSPLPRIQLGAGQMVVLNLADFQNTRQIPEDATWGTVTLNYTGRSGDLVAVAMSYDQTNRYGLQTPFSEIMNHLFKGSMWHADTLRNALITMGNGGTEPTNAQLTLFYNGGKDKYRVEQALAPGQQIWLNVGEVISKQIPDSDGKTIPPDVMFGSYELRDLGHPVVGLLYEGKLIVDKTYGHASYGCAHCCGYTRAQLSPTPFSGPPGINNTDGYQAYDACTSSWSDFDAFFNPYSNNTAVATLTVSTLHTVAIGAATTSGKDDVPYQSSPSSCPNVNMQGTQGVSVKPTISSINAGQGLVGTAENVTITGTGFASGATVYAGPNVPVSNVKVNSSIQITATFTPANSTSAGGNQPVTVTVGGQPSDPKNFYVQIPTHFQFVDATGAPGGKGPVVPVTNGNVVDLNGKVIQSNYCGVYENFAYEILDQQSNSLLNGTATGTEVFTNVSIPPGPTPKVIAINFATEAWNDTQAWKGTYPTYCPIYNDNQSLDYSMTMTIGTVVYPLVTVVHYTKGNFSGTLNVTAAVTTQ